MSKFSMDDYIDVAERIQDFKDAHPDGTLQTLDWSVCDVAGKHFIVYRAAAYRTAEDTRPGHGIAWEPFPGGTPYTRNSELMNAETAAWGRAIVALGLTANRALASRQEVRARREEQEAESPPAPAKPKRGKKAAETPIKPVSDTPITDPNPTFTPNDAKAEKPGEEIVNDITLEGLRKTIGASGKTDDQVAWLLLSVGVESLPENPSRADLKAGMETMTVDQALRLDALLTDESVPGSGEAA